MIAMPVASLSGMTLRVTEDASRLAPDSSVAPRASVWRAMSRAERVLVPSVSMSAVMPKAPARAFGSAQPPVFRVRSAVTSGRSEDRATITRSPLASVRSAGFGKTGATGAPTGGGAWRWPSGARAKTGPE